MDNLEFMTDQERRDELADLAATWYETSAWKAKFERDAYLGKGTVSQWYSRSVPPLWALIMVQAWTDAHNAKAEAEQMREDTEPMRLAAFQIEKVKEALKMSPPAPDDI